MYMVPQRMPAPRAAHTPRMECALGPSVDEAAASRAAPKHITKAPPNTPAQRRQPACRNSLKKTHPHNMPSRLFEFHSGKAMLKPTSRMAKIVMVLATAHRHPAKTAQIRRCGARRMSAWIDDVPRINAGTLQRARKTPITMISEMTMGEIPTETSLVGASAAPSHAPAAKPESMPNVCNLRAREAASASDSICEANRDSIIFSPRSVNRPEKKQASNQYGNGNPKLNIGQHVHEPASARFRWIASFHSLSDPIGAPSLRATPNQKNSAVRVSLLQCPERLLGGHKLHRHVFYERFQPARALLHAGLLGRHVPDHDQRLFLAFRDSVGSVLHRFPFAPLADQQHLDVVHLQHVRLSHESGGSGIQCDLGHFHLRMPHHAQYRSVQALGHVCRKFLDSSLWNREQILIVGVLIFFPAKRVHHAGLDPVCLHPVPVIVKSPHHKPVLLDECPFLGPHRIALLHPFRFILVIVKRRLVRDDQVLSICRGALE